MPAHSDQAPAHLATTAPTEAPLPTWRRPRLRQCPTHVLYIIFIFNDKMLAQTVFTSWLAACGRAASERAAHGKCRAPPEEAVA